MGLPAKDQQQTIKIGPLGQWNPQRSVLLTITPAQAQEILDRCNTRNRRQTKGIIDRITTALIEGHWQVNGETIIFSSAGVLLDGQNRLAACVAANIPLTTWVVFGMDDQAFQTIDRGRNRELACDLSILQYTDATLLAATSRVVYAYLAGIRHQSLLSSKSGMSFDSQDAIGFIEANPGLHESVTYSRHRKIPAPPRLIGASHYLFGKSDPTARDRFFAALESGANLEPGSPILALRQRLYQEREGESHKRRKSSGTESAFVIFSAIVRAWNHYRRGNKVGKIQVPNRINSKGQPVPDVLPEII